MTVRGRVRPGRAVAGCLALAALVPLAAGTAAAERAAPQVLLAARSRVERAEPKPPPASELLVLSPEGGAWQARSYSDPDSRVFHKAIGYTPAVGAPGVITIGGLGAAVKLWRVRAGGLAPAETLWQARFGGRVDRMRDVEAGDLFGDGGAALAVATHDQGVIAVLRPRGRSFEVRELERRANTWVHEVELGDIDGDGVLELYATPSEPNRLGIPQGGEVVRFVAGRAEWRRVVATFAGRHAKEILLADLDDDGRDELYVSVEAVTGGRAEIRRYRAETPPDAGELVAALPDAMCRFLVAGDLDGDRRRELVIAARDSGVWLARPRPTLPWRLESIDRESGGFEHAALIADLDVNGRDELYVASDQHQELRRYEWVRGRQRREVIWRGAASEHVVTWSLGAAPRTLVEAEGAPSPRTAAARLPDTRGQWRLRSTPPSEPP